MSRYEQWVSRERDTCALADMKAYLRSARPVSRFSTGDVISGSNRMGDYSYTLSRAPARVREDLFADFLTRKGEVRAFRPHLLPAEMLRLGVFEGRMINDCMMEFPREWFSAAIAARTLRPRARDVACNLYRVRSGQSLRTWRGKGWILGPDERGWFQWFCRYALGRRDPDLDTVQMRRWHAIARWRGVIARHPNRPRVRQNLLQWSWPHEPASEPLSQLPVTGWTRTA